MFRTGYLHNYLRDMECLCVLLLYWRFSICSHFNHASNPRAANRDCVARNKTEEAIILCVNWQEQGNFAHGW